MLANLVSSAAKSGLGSAVGLVGGGVGGDGCLVSTCFWSDEICFSRVCILWFMLSIRSDWVVIVLIDLSSEETCLAFLGCNQAL